MKHTPGNWIAVGDWVELCDDTRADICSVNPCDFGQSFFGRNEDEMRANARLIAAAPDLLAALERNIISFQGDPIDVIENEYGLGTAQRIDAARKAIAKAKGETQ